jgi:hypothetical protein
VLFTNLPDKIRSAFTAAQGTPEFQAAVRAHPEQAQALQGAANGGSSALNDTSFVNRLADALSHPFKVGFAESMSLAFMLAAGIMVVGLVLVFLLPELPLRQGSAAEEREAELRAADAALED